MTSESAEPTRPGTGPNASGSTGFVARQRAEPDRSRDPAAASAVLERAKGALMALTGCSARAAHDELLRRARASHRTLIEECRLILATPRNPPPQPRPLPSHPTPNTPTNDPPAADAPSHPTPYAPTDDLPATESSGHSSPDSGDPSGHGAPATDASSDSGPPVSDAPADRLPGPASSGLGSPATDASPDSGPPACDSPADRLPGSASAGLGSPAPGSGGTRPAATDSPDPGTPSGSPPAGGSCGPGAELPDPGPAAHGTSAASPPAGGSSGAGGGLSDTDALDPGPGSPVTSPPANASFDPGPPATDPPHPGASGPAAPATNPPSPVAPSPSSPSSPTPVPPGPAVPVSRPWEAGGAEEDGGVLGRFGAALVGVGSPEELARCVLEHLRPEVGADAVMVYARLPEGGLELIGHAGIDRTLAAQWRRVPPLAGIAALDALRTREPRWLEDIELDARRYLLIGDPPERWLSRAWLPVVAGDTAEVSIGVLRGRAGPFPPRVRERLLAVARLCAGRLREFDTRREPAAHGGADAVQAVLDTLPGAAVLLSPLRTAAGEIEDYRVEAASPETVDVVGRSGRELVGRRILECWPLLADETLWRGCAHTLATGESYEGEPYGQRELVAGSAELSTYRVRVARLGGGLVVSRVRYDPSDRQERRLADVQRLGNLGWANWNLVTQEITWSAQVFTVLGRDPAQGPVRLADLPGLALPEDAPVLAHALDELVDAGRRVDAPFRIRTASGVRHLRIVAEAVTDLRGTPVEVHGFLQDLTAQRRAELALVASERAMLTQHGALRAERALAGRLQHALLPLPDKSLQLAGLRVEVAYLPAQSGVQVGGDWFSAIELSDDAALFVVGDVAGHGVGAVATMAQLRFTAKGMVITGSSLTGALGRLNTLLLHSRDAHGTATLMLARYQARGRRLVWAQAGHPPPLLLRDGVARFLDRPRGVLLGACAEPSFEEAECLLRPGDRLLLYTDGLVERPGEGIDSGLQRLAEAAMAHDRDEPGSLGPLLTVMLEGERRDDVCVLDIRVPAEPETPGTG